MRPYRNFLVIFLLLVCGEAYCQQQDVEFHLNAHLLTGKTILKVKRDFYDPYVWALGKNNEVYRINSITKVVDNYTTQFAAYSNLEFVDIAGFSNNQVFIATNSPIVIQYNNGATNLIDKTYGIKGNVNSVGIDYTKGLTTTSGDDLLIGTEYGIYVYDIDRGTGFASSGNDSARLFEATYRRFIYAALGEFSVPDTIIYYPITYITGQATYLQYVWLGGKSFGSNLKTAFYTPYGFDDYQFEDGTDLFWGTEKGMAQNVRDLSSDSQRPSRHYLHDIPVNKITDIYGLTAFGGNGSLQNPGLTKQTLLVGTDKGLYFSSNIYDNYEIVNGVRNGLRLFSLFHYDELDNIRVNDICVNATNTIFPYCEDGVWVACDNGLYLLKPDYAKYINNQKLQVLTFQGKDLTVTQTNICEGSSATAVLTGLYTGTNIQWYKDGNELPGQTQTTLDLTTKGDYYAVLYDPCENIHIETNHLSVQVISAPIFSFNYPNQIQHCDNTPITLKTDDDPIYTYRWYSNGVLNGETSSSFTVMQTGKYKVEVSACTGTWVSSKEVEVDLVTLPVPQITADKVIYCADDQAVLTENVPVDASYNINWYRDGNLLPGDKDITSIKTTTAGSYTAIVSSTIANCSQSSIVQPIAFTPAPVFTFDYPDKLQYCDGTPITLKPVGSANYQYRWYKDGQLTGDITPSLAITQSGKYKVEVSACSGSWLGSKEVEVNFVKLPTAVIITNKPAYCIGDNATLSTTPLADPFYTINWYKDNVLITENKNLTSFSTNIAGSYTVSIVNNTANSDGSICSQASELLPLVFNPPPTVSIEQIINNTLCDGQTIFLKANHTSGTAKWSTGETSDQISVTQSGNYKVTVTSPAGCTVDANMNVTFFANPVLSIANTSICAYTQKMITLSAPGGFAKYEWNGTTGNEAYDVHSPQTVSLTVTDAHGCQTTQQIIVTDQCPDIHIPNTFTPNGDLINDTWDIKGLQDDPTALVQVFTRYGNKIFESRGYPKPWDGENQGKKLPTGTYYYIITAKKDTQTFSGYVAIIY